MAAVHVSLLTITCGEHVEHKRYTRKSARTCMLMGCWPTTRETETLMLATPQPWKKRVRLLVMGGRVAIGESKPW